MKQPDPITLIRLMGKLQSALFTVDGSTEVYIDGNLLRSFILDEDGIYLESVIVRKDLP